ncbi:hypothetical protein [Histidinibacterium lentulum]|uniref:ATP-grasp domain-containing protein n=1 Tax=Histidinibacterium lentulum TaxID=2480588 RepID=A0A3N2R7G1_9RHOB|nr:hypothetical protein [Histidinibacterium lentulum]ROU03367.1 hypothetical protein EAT49_03400 [Histidinibacterium lentulum]
MIRYICRAWHRYTMDRFLTTLPPDKRGMLQILTYEELFATRELSPSHMIFTDFDRLSPFELEIAASVAQSLHETHPDARVLNHPARFLQRHELLELLWSRGLNPFRSARLDLPLPELRFPVFLRREGDARGPETGLLQTPDELHASIAGLRDRGIPLRGRLAVEYCDCRDAEGLYRKYGAFRVGAQILPQHIQISRDWIVKSRFKQVTPAHVAEEEAYVRDNPHREALLGIMDLGGADFGRIDYAVLGGRIVVFEINSNPSFPGPDRQDARQDRRSIVRGRLIDALSAVDTPLAKDNPIEIRLPRRFSHDLCPPAPFQDIGRALWGYPLARRVAERVARVMKARESKGR